MTTPLSPARLLRGPVFVACASCSPWFTDEGTGYKLRMRKSTAQMKLHRKYIFAIFGVAVFCAAAGSPALTLGRARGAVLLGQPLKLTVPIQLESGEGPSALCFDADVFYGDNKQDASRVGVITDVSSQSQLANVYVSAVANVDEPVVTVYLRAGCAGKTSRRYVLLADLATELARQPLDAVAPTRALSDAAAPWAKANPADVSETTRSRPTNGRVSATGTGLASPHTLAANSKPSVATRRPASSRPRLKLAPVDLTVNRDPTLKLSNELLLGDLEDLQKRAQAVALWQSLNASPEDVLSAQSRRQALETDLKGLHDVTAKNRQILEELTRRLDTAETERYSNPLVYGLMATLFALGLGWVYVRSRRQQVNVGAPLWWRDEGSADRAGVVTHDSEGASAQADNGWSHSVLPETSSSVQPEGGAAKPVAGMTEVDIDLPWDALVDVNQDGMPLESGPETAPTAKASTALGHHDFADSMTTTLRAVNTKEMLDIRQQAEFFMTLGQHQEAVDILAENIDAGVEANPLVYLDLLKVLHTLGRKAGYDHYRNAFNAIFSGSIPEYADFNHGGNSLEAYPDVCHRLVQLWPSEEAVAYIEKCLVSRSDGDAANGFDLEAFRDLLMLHGVAMRMDSALDTGFSSFGTARTVATEADSPKCDAAVDFDLSEPPGNLIEFDAAVLLPPKGHTGSPPGVGA